MREPISKRTRFEVFKRDGFRCTYCGNRPPDVVLVIDHVVPVAEGGSSESINLTTACYACNAGKSAVPLAEAMPAVSEEAIAEAMQEVAERRILLSQHFAATQAYALDLESGVEAMLGEWMALLARAGDPSWNESADSSFDRQSIVNFMRRGLSVEDMKIAVRTVHAGWTNDKSRRSLWLHFCRICWDAINGTLGAK